MNTEKPIENQAVTSKSGSDWSAHMAVDGVISGHHFSCCCMKMLQLLPKHALDVLSLETPFHLGTQSRLPLPLLLHCWE